MQQRPVSPLPIVRVGFAVFGLLTLATLLLTLISERGFFAVREREAQAEELREQIEAMQAENAAMLEEIANLNDPWGGEIERRAREELNLVLPGEVVITHPSDETRAPAN